MIGIIFICLFYVAQQQVFKGSGRSIFEAFLMLIASALITLLAMMMLKYKGYEEKWRAKLENASQAQVFSYFTAPHNATKLPYSTMQLVIC